MQACTSDVLGAHCSITLINQLMRWLDRAIEPKLWQASRNSKKTILNTQAKDCLMRVWVKYLLSKQEVTTLLCFSFRDLHILAWLWKGSRTALKYNNNINEINSINTAYHCLHLPSSYVYIYICTNVRCDCLVHCCYGAFLSAQRFYQGCLSFPYWLEFIAESSNNGATVYQVGVSRAYRVLAVLIPVLFLVSPSAFSYDWLHPWIPKKFAWESVLWTVESCRVIYRHSTC